MKKLIVLLLIATAALAGHAQDFRQQFEDFKKNAQTDFYRFRDSLNYLFADYLSQKWEHFEIQQPLPSPNKPEPSTPPRYLQGTAAEAPVVIPVTRTPLVSAATSTRPLQLPAPPPLSAEEQAQAIVLAFDFFGTPVQLSAYPEFMIFLNDHSETAVSEAWRQLTQSPYPELIRQLLQIKGELQLNDWGLYQLVSKFAAVLFTAEQQDEKTVFTVFLLNQIGYNAKISLQTEALVEAVAFEQKLYGQHFFKINGERYYLFNTPNPKLGCTTYRLNYEAAIADINLAASEPVRLVLKEDTRPLDIVAAGVTRLFRYNKNIIDYYNTYPQTEMQVYAVNPMSNTMKNNIAQQLTPYLKDKNETEAVSFLLHFVQTAFEYKTDREQFGREKWFFAEELFYYPYSNCKHRAVLFTQLVRQLTELSVVMLDYSDHVATAVAFNSEVQGDSFHFDGKRYTVCDPTYVNADIGMTMPAYKEVEAKIVVLK